MKGFQQRIEVKRIIHEVLVVIWITDWLQEFFFLKGSALLLLDSNSTMNDLRVFFYNNNFPHRNDSDPFCWDLIRISCIQLFVSLPVITNTFTTLSAHLT